MSNHKSPARSGQMHPQTVRTLSPLARAVDRAVAGLSPRQRSGPEGLQERRINTPGQARSAALQPSSWNADDRTIDVIWTTGARGVNIAYDTFELVDEELATAAKNVRLDRLNRGAPVLNSHQSRDLNSQIGVVVPGSARMESGRGIATIQLSVRDEIAPIVADIAAGVIRNISVGYRVHAYDVDPSAKPRPLYRATDWEPTEISFVTVPLDAGAQVRSPADETTSCLIRNIAPKEPRMSFTDIVTRWARPRPAPAPTPAPTSDERSGPQDDLPYGEPATIEQLRSHVDMFCDAGLVERHEASELVLELAQRSLSRGEARDTLMQIAAERQRQATGGFRSAGRADETYDNPSFHSRAIGDALFARMSGTAPTAEARQFMHMPMVQIAGELLTRGGMRDVNRMSPEQILRAASWNNGGLRSMGAHQWSRDIGGMLTTSDFPELLMGAGERYLLQTFAAAASPLKRLSRQRTARDFRAISGIQLSGGGTLDRTPEGAEITYSAFKERKETYKLETWTKGLTLSFQAIVNDDLGAFNDNVAKLARMASETEAQLLAKLVTDNPIMGDGIPLFHANHGNLAAVGGPPSVEALSAGRKAMRNQKDADGVTPLAAAPAFILSGSEHETVIDQLLTQITPALYGDVSPFAGKLESLIDPRLDGLPWYLFGAPGNAPVLEHAYLNDQIGPRVEMQEAWDTLGTQFRVIFHFGAGVVSSPGAYKNPGK